MIILEKDALIESPPSELAGIEAACPGWQAKRITLTDSYSARRGPLEVHGRRGADVVAEVRRIEKALGRRA